MDEHDFQSESDASDEDFCPETIEVNSDVSSSEEFDEDATENSEKQGRSISKKKNKNSGIKRRRTQNAKTEADEFSQNQNNSENQDKRNEEAEKARADALWADFLGDSNATKSNVNTSRSSLNSKSSETAKAPKPSSSEEQNEKQRKKTVTEIFDFAGEEVKITKEIPIDESKPTKSSQTISTNSSNTTSQNTVPTKRPSGGLNSILGQIGKKSKISVLEKTKLDWDHFKKKEDLNEELNTFNKGKDGYLERQDFLQRTDLRQFELEKNLRQTKRSNR